MHLALKLFLEKGDDYVVGPGRIGMLRLVRELGSLLKAAERMGMSYRWAWGRVKRAEEALGIPLLCKSTGALRGRPRGLTPEAEELLDWYTRAEEQLQGVLTRIEADMPKILAERVSKTPSGKREGPFSD